MFKLSSGNDRKRICPALHKLHSPSALLIVKSTELTKEALSIVTQLFICPLTYHEMAAERSASLNTVSSQL
jgi:hypothetical protein